MGNGFGRDAMASAVLVTYATKSGSTAGIAQKIAEHLKWEKLQACGKAGMPMVNRTTREIILMENVTENGNTGLKKPVSIVRSLTTCSE
jgi:hypothetical protein